MGFITSSSNVSELETIEELRRFVSIFCDDVKFQVNGRISINQNTDSQIITVLFATADVNQVIPHKLGRVPIGYITVGSVDTANIIYNDGSQIWTNENIILKCNFRATMKVLVF